MPAKTRSPRARKVPTIQERFKAHLEASQQCERWAKKALAHHHAGRAEAAQAAFQKARRYMARMMNLEPK